MHVLESVKKYDEVVNLCQRQLKKPRVSEERNNAGVKCKKDVICVILRRAVSVLRQGR